MQAQDTSTKDTEFNQELAELDLAEKINTRDDIYHYITSLATKEIKNYNFKQLNFMLDHFFSKEDYSQETTYYKNLKDFLHNTVISTNPKAIRLKVTNTNFEELNTSTSSQGYTISNDFLKHKKKRFGEFTDQMKCIYKPRITNSTRKI